MPEATPAPAAPTIVHPGDVIQITDQADKWFPAILVVDEVKGWGVQAYLYVAHNDGTPAGQAFYRLKHGKFALTGGRAIVATREQFMAREASLETARLLAEESKTPANTG